MGQASALGFFDYERNSLSFTVNESKVDRQHLITACCENMRKQSIDSLTLKFDDQMFLFFLRNEENIRFVEGSFKDYPKLVSRVKFSTDEQEPEVIPVIQKANARSVKESSNDTGGSTTKEPDHALLQRSMYQPMSYFQKAYSNAELYFKPLDDTGGDFYWTKDYQYKNLVVLGDCTGHGTFGSMIAMSVMTLLKQFFRLPPTSLTNALIDFHKQMLELMEDEVLEVFDVELAILVLDKRTKELTYAGSGVNVVIKTKKGTTQLKSRKSQLILGRVKEEKVKLKKSDQLYVSSDGIFDQFDVDNKKRLGSSNFQKMVESLPFDNSLDHFNRKFEEFKGDTPQLDDQSMLILTL